MQRARRTGADICRVAAPVRSAQVPSGKRADLGADTRVASYIYYLIQSQSDLYTAQNIMKIDNEVASCLGFNCIHDEGHAHTYASQL